MWDSVLGIFGQSAEQAAQRDMRDYDPSKGGLKDRQGLEVLGDMLRGGSGAVNDAARELHMQNLKGTEAAQYLESRGIDPEIAATSTKSKLLGQARKEKKAESRADRTENYETDPVRIKADADAATEREYRRSTDAENTRRYEAGLDRQYSLDRERVAEKKEGRLDRIDQRMSDREIRMLELGQQERMFDKRLQSDARADKKQRMAAIIAGLANLGGAFAI